MPAYRSSYSVPSDSSKENEATGASSGGSVSLLRPALYGTPPHTALKAAANAPAQPGERRKGSPVKFQPDYHYLEDAARNRTPKRFPLYEHIVDSSVMEAALGVRFSSLEM